MAKNQDEKEPMLPALTDTGRKEIRSASLTMASVADAIDAKQNPIKSGSQNTTHVDPNISHVFHRTPDGFQCGEK